MILKAYKYRLYPTRKQTEMLNKHFGCTRWLYNYALAKKKEAYERDKTNIPIRSIQDELPLLKKSEQTKWLSEVNAQSLQAALQHLDKAYKKFFKEKKGFPKFKSKHIGRQSFQCPANKREICWDNSTLTVPKIKDIPIILTRKFEGTVKTVTISKTPTNKYFVSILVETEENIPEKPPVDQKTTIGIDLGIKDFAITSDSKKYENHKYLKQSIERLKVLQKRASRKEKGSNNRRRANMCVSRLHEKITNQRNDFLHKLSSKLISENQTDTICLESLAVNNLIKNHKLAQSISDVSWSKFTEMLKYKAEWNGKNLIFIDRFSPSSKKCNNCGFINQELKLSDRQWTCPQCNLTHDRDINGAKNIKIMGLQQYSGGASPAEPVEDVGNSRIGEAGNFLYLKG